MMAVDAHRGAGFRIVADERDEGCRADVVLARHIPELSRRVARAMARAGRLLIDGERRPPSFVVTRGCRLELCWTPQPSTSPSTVTELHCSAEYVYVDKPPGVHTHRLRPNHPVAVADLVAAIHPECADAAPDPREGGAVHRLDRATSGVLAFARSRAAWTAARQAFTQRTVEKIYLALCTAPTWPAELPPACTFMRTPCPVAGAELAARVLEQPQGCDEPGITIALALGHGRGRNRVAPRPAGERCVTHVWPLARSHASERPIWLVAARLDTGFRHQARVHLAAIGLPIVGDDLYGPSRSNHERLLLHAYRLGLGPELDAARVCVAPPWPRS